MQMGDATNIGFIFDAAIGLFDLWCGQYKAAKQVPAFANCSGDGTRQ